MTKYKKGEIEHEGEVYSLVEGDENQIARGVGGISRDELHNYILNQRRRTEADQDLGYVDIDQGLIETFLDKRQVESTTDIDERMLGIRANTEEITASIGEQRLGKVKIDVEQEGGPLLFEGHTDNVLSVFVDSGTSTGFSGGNEDTVRKWDSNDMTETDESPYNVNDDNATSLDVTDNHIYVGTGFAENFVEKVDRTDMTETDESPFEGHTATVNSVFVDTGNNVGFSGSGDDTVRKWDSNDMTETDESPFEGHTAAVNSVFVDTGNNVGFSGSNDDTVRKWDSNDMTETDESPFDEHTSNVQSVFVDTGNNVGFSGSNDDTVRKWDAETMETIKALWKFFTEGTIQHETISLGFTPTTFKVFQDADIPDREGDTLEYELEDENANTQVITQNDITNGEAEINDLTGTEVTVTVRLKDSNEEKESFNDAVELKGLGLKFEG